jgi:dTDP-4-dehydrorhamnose 3,5-epimerase
MHRKLSIPDVVLLEPKRYFDDRGYFTVTHNKDELSNIVGRNVEFVQDNESQSIENVLRGLHYQISSAQDKLVRTISGGIFDVAVDLRRGSETFGHWVGEVLSEDNGHQLWIPKGFAHGFLVLSKTAKVSYKVTNYWSPKDERCIRWDDPDLKIDWPIKGAVLLSEKDAAGSRLSEAEIFVEACE